MAEVEEIKTCTKQNSHPTVPLADLVEKIMLVAEAMTEKKLFPYQKEFMYRVVEAVLLHDGDMLTVLMSRQIGKTEAIAAVMCALSVILPSLATMPIFQDDWRLNCTDEQGNYRGYKNGIKIGIFAPIQEQADIAFNRVRDILSTDTSKQFALELSVGYEISNSNRVHMTNGSKVRSQSASENTKIEGESYHIIFLDEAQDISFIKISKSISPMTSAYNGVIVKIGTCSIHKSDFYTSIKKNERLYAQGGPRNHFYYPYEVGQKYNSMYRDYIEKEKIRLGIDSDEFQLSYAAKWLLERGQFITSEILMRPETALLSGPFSKIHESTGRFSTQVAGIDIGKIHDPTVVTIIDVDWHNPVADEYVDTPQGSYHFVAYNKHIISWMMLMGDNYEEQFSQITEYLARFKGLRKIVIDSTGVGQWGCDRFSVHYSVFDRGMSKDGTPDMSFVDVQGFDFNAQSKSELFKLFHSDLSSSRLTFPAGEEARKSPMFRRFVGEMLDLRKNYRNNYMTCSAPEEPGAHDDFPTSAGLSCWGAQYPVETGEAIVSTNLFMR